MGREVRGKHFERVEATWLPLGKGVEVGTKIGQNVNHGRAAGVVDRRGVEAAGCSVEEGPKPGMGLKEEPKAGGVVAMESGHSLLQDVGVHYRIINAHETP